MKVLIITGGNIDDDFAFSFLKNNPYNEIIAVDGGLAFADRAGVNITHLVGDFDTIDAQILEKYIHREDISVHRFIPEKDYTDTDIAVKLALELFKEQKDAEQQLHIIGGTGSRLDHVLANLQMLKRVMDAGVQGILIDRNNQIQMISGTCHLKRQGIFGKYVSLIPVTMDVSGITLEGFKYPLNRAVTHFGESLCVSNELVDDEGWITIEEGIAWMILSRD
jgi:thiamine pyrophosphokinase